MSRTRGWTESDVAAVGKPVRTAKDIAADYHDGLERGLQKQCETWLGQQGYLPRTDCIQTSTPRRGTYFHMRKPQKNWCLLDLVIFDLTDRVLEVELKTEHGSLEPNQAAIVRIHKRVVVRSLQQFIYVLERWEDAGL
jgi:hypothetical protein